MIFKNIKTPTKDFYASILIFHVVDYQIRSKEKTQTFEWMIT